MHIASSGDFATRINVRAVIDGANCTLAGRYSMSLSPKKPVAAMITEVNRGYACRPIRRRDQQQNVFAAFALETITIAPQCCQQRPSVAVLRVVPAPPAVTVALLSTAEPACPHSARQLRQPTQHH